MKRIKINILIITLILSLTFVFWGCDDETATQAPNFITITGPGIVVVGTSIQLTANPIPATASLGNVLWSISSTSTFDAGTSITGIASINVSGILTALTPAEQTTIYVFVSSGDIRSSGFAVTVQQFSLRAYGRTNVMAGVTEPGFIRLRAERREAPTQSVETLSWHLRATDNFNDSTPVTVAKIERIQLQLPDPPPSNPHVYYNIGELTTLTVNADTDVWVFARDEVSGVVSSSHRVTVRKFEAYPAAFVLDSWEWDSELETGNYIWRGLSVLAGDNHNISSTDSSNKKITWTTMTSSHVEINSTGLVLASGARLLIGTPVVTTTDAATFHEEGQFNLGDTGLVRVTVSYTRTAGEGGLILFLNSANTAASAACVHGFASGSGSNPADFRHLFPALNTNERYTSSAAFNLETLSERENPESALALNSSFFQLQSPSPSTFTVHFIKIEIAELQPPPPLEGINILSPGTVMAGDGNTGSGTTINLRGFKVPADAEGHLDLTWVVRSENSLTTGAVSSIATITNGVLKAQDEILTAETVVWVFATDTTTNITSLGHRVVVLPFDPDLWITVFNWKMEDQTESIPQFAANSTGLRQLTGQPMFITIGSKGGNISANSTTGINISSNHGRLIIGGRGDAAATTPGTFDPNGEFILWTRGTLRVTIVYTRSAAGNINFFMNNNTNGGDNSVFGSAANRTHAAVSGSNTATFEYDLGSLAGTDTSAPRYRALSSSFFQFNTGSGQTGAIQSFLVEYGF
jgi:hypothetical protein